MMLRRSALLCLLAVCALALLAPGIAGATPTYDQAVKQLISDGYPQTIETYLNSLGANPLGFRLAGTDEEQAASTYLAAEFESMGLDNVRLEPVPVDAYELLGASVTVGSREMTASQFPGIPGTPLMGITGDVVYVHDGTAADFDAAGDVTGKIVLIDTFLEDFWLNSPGAEATLRGATAVISTYGPDSYPWYAIAPNALGWNDGEYMDHWVPFVYLARQDGDWLKSRLAAAATAATVKSAVQVTPHNFDSPEAGGVGYNVVAELPGTSKDGKFVLVASHQDAHFRCGLDDTGALVAEMTMAKAMMMSGARPKRTVVFLLTSGEEFGYGNSYFDYLTGAWWAISHAHPNWAGRAVAMLNLECFARPGAASANTSRSWPSGCAGWRRPTTTCCPGGWTSHPPRVRGTMAGRCSPPVCRPSPCRPGVTTSGSAITLPGRPRRPSTGSTSASSRASWAPCNAGSMGDCCHTTCRTGPGASRRRSRRLCCMPPAFPPPT